MNRGVKAPDEQITAGESVADALRLDGNAAAGILSELFVPDLTAARATCAGCGASRVMGELLVYAHGMGTVVRCPGCDTVVLCVTRTATQVWLDPTGVRRIVMAAAPRPA
jgi:Family of unknown function (DUF6510)